MKRKPLTIETYGDFDKAVGDIPATLWDRGHELWRCLRWEPLNSERAVRMLVPLIVRAAKADELEAKLAEEAA